MSEQLHQVTFQHTLPTSQLPATLAGDVAAAGISATLVSPLITAIDRAVVENAAYRNKPLLGTLREHIVSSIRQPRAFFISRPFLYVWTLYAATYTTANSIESIATAVTRNADQLLVSSLTFLATCAVNVPLGVWKDVRFVQTFGRSAAPPRKPPDNHTTASEPVPIVKSTRFPRAVAATFLVRDALTIFGSLNLPPLVAPLIPPSTFSSPATQTAALQLCVPVLSQVVATPVHLLALDLYGFPEKQGWRRAERVRRGMGGVMAFRCARIVPAFGVGLVVNGWLRGWFHGGVGRAEMRGDSGALRC